VPHRRLGITVWRTAIWATLLPLALASLSHAQEAPLCVDCSTYGVAVTPDGTTAPANTINSSGFQNFTVQNTGNTQDTYTLTCSGSSGVTCTSSLTPITVAAFSQKTVKLSFSVGGTVGTGRLNLFARSSLDFGDGGHVFIPIVTGPGKARVDLVHRDIDHIDRGLCFTSGAGEAAGISCGDLFVTHAMPAYRTLGRDRALTLYYNSATARGSVLVPGYVGQAEGILLPTKMRVVLEVGSASDSAEFGADAYPTRRQVVLGRGLGRIPTGVYTQKLRVTNVYSSSSLDSVVTGMLLVVNRDTSEFGRGWSLLGLERVLLDPTDSTRRIWAGGDGSARLFHRGVGLTSATLSQSGLSGFNAAAATDHNIGTSAWPSTAAAGAWLRVDLGTGSGPQAATTLGAYAIGSNSAVYDIQYSDNATVWRTASAGFRPSTTGWHWASWTSVGPHRYWRLLQTNTTGSGAGMSELSLGEATTFYGAPGAAPDSLVRFNNQGAEWFRHDYKHGVKVMLDATGHHRITVNRLGAQTLFNWGTVNGKPRLMSIDVPPNDGTSRRYQFVWDPTTGMLKSITDPAQRTLTATMNGDALVKLTDHDGGATRFVYANNRMGARNAPRRGLKGDSVVTTFGFTTGGQEGVRVTTVRRQVDSAQTKYLTTTLVPWDQQGMALGYTGQTGVVVTDTLGLQTRIDGPRSGLGDAVDVWLDRFGAPRRVVDLGLNKTTSIYREAGGSLPAQVTRVDYPTGRRVTMAYNGRGNLTLSRDVIPAMSGGVPALPTRVRAWVYGSSLAPDGPTEVHDSINQSARVTRYTYTRPAPSVAPEVVVLDNVVDPRGHQTKFGYQTAPLWLLGMVQSVTEMQVDTWQDNVGEDITDTKLDQVQSFTYDDNGNLRSSTSPINAKTVYTADGAGRITEVFDPIGSYTKYEYDPMNRVERVLRPNTPRDNPYSINQLLGCKTLQSTCVDGSQAPGTARTDTARYFSTLSVLDSIWDPRHVVRAYRYDGLRNIWKETDDYGVTKTATYGELGVLETFRARTGHQVQYTYNSLGQRTNLVYPQVPSQDTVTPSTIPGDNIVYTYDGFGQLASATNRHTTITRTYYGDGALHEKRTIIGTATRTLTYRYDATGALRMLVSRHDDTAQPGTRWDSTGYEYGNTTGRLDRVVAYWGAPVNQVDAFTFQWDGLGRRRQVTYPGGYAMTVKYRYDAAGILRRVVASHSRAPSSGGSNLFQFIFRNTSVDPVGRIQRQELLCQGIVGSAAGNPCTSGGTLFLDNQYDRFGQLLKQVSNQAAGTDSMAYDASGNMSFRSHDGGRHFYKMAAGHNRLVVDSIAGVPKPLAVDYTADGARHWEHPDTAVFSLRYRSYYYDGLGRMTGSRRVDPLTTQPPVATLDRPDACRYDADGQLYRVCDNAAPLLVFDGANAAGSVNTDAWTFVHGPGLDDPLAGVIRRTNGTTRVLYFVTDGAGRQFAVAAADGVLPATENTGTGAHWRYAGATKAPNTFDADRMSSSDLPTLSYFRNRVYDQETGRWTQEDPIGVAGGLNLYQFNGNNPVAYTDPFGLHPCRHNPEKCQRTGGPTLGALVSQTLGAAKDFAKNYMQMREANTKGADKYFHCKANCEAAQRGPVGAKVSEVISEAREFVDQHVFGDPPDSSEADRSANTTGRVGGANSDVPCQLICAPHRPRGLDEKE
jgi:RHS repeat-associated protein